MQRIDHTKCNHEATPKARRACRNAQRAELERPGPTSEALPVGTAAQVQARQPFNKRAIVVNMRLASGKRCSATFDRYGQNSELYRTALAYGWGAERTVAQAISEALAGALRAYPGDATVDYRVVEVD